MCFTCTQRDRIDQPMSSDRLQKARAKIARALIASDRHPPERVPRLTIRCLFVFKLANGGQYPTYETWIAPQDVTPLFGILIIKVL